MTIILCAAIMLVQLLDVGYSSYAIRRYRLTEGNPTWRWLARDPLWFMVVSTIAHAILLIVLLVIRVPAWAFGFGLAARIFVVIRNNNLVNKAREIGKEK